METKINSAMPKMIKTDKQRLQQLLRIFVSNQIKFIQRGEIKIFAHFNQSANWLEVEIKDTGIGIKNEDLDNIFQPFWKVQN